MVNKHKIIAIVGPTASGKSTLAIAIAKKFDGEIVSADSRQIYRGMDIGTAKPLKAEMEEVPHHLIDIKNPDEEYTVADYKNDAEEAINTILGRKKLPILVGGTGLYLKTIVENLDIPKISANPALRATIEKDIEEKGLGAVFKQLITLDPNAEQVVDGKNPRRVVRALEVAITTGAPFTAQRKKHQPLYDALILGINPPQELLRQRINQRVDVMIKDGLVSEVTRLLKDYGSTPIAFDSIGYREIIDHLNGTRSLDDAIALIKINTWHYAKRQMTWFKKDLAVHWIKHSEEGISLVEKFLR